MPAPTTLLMPRGMWGEPYRVLSGIGVDGAHNTVGKMSAPTTLFGFCHAREVARYCPAGVQGTVLGIAVDLSALPYFLCPFPGPYRAGVPDRLVPIGSDCASRRRAVSRGLPYPWSETRVGVGSDVRPGPPVGEAIRRWVGDRSERFGRRGGPESKADAVPPRLGLPIGEAGWS